MNYRIIYNDELYHYGVKGMRWGHRKGPASLARTQQLKKAAAAAAADAAKMLKVDGGDGGIVSKPKGTPKGGLGGPTPNKVPKGSLGEKSGRVSFKAQAKNSTYRRYGKGNTPLDALKRDAQNKKAFTQEKRKELKAAKGPMKKGKVAVSWYLDMPVTVMGVTGTKEMTVRERYKRGDGLF